MCNVLVCDCEFRLSASSKCSRVCKNVITGLSMRLQVNESIYVRNIMSFGSILHFYISIFIAACNVLHVRCTDFSECVSARLRCCSSELFFSFYSQRWLRLWPARLNLLNANYNKIERTFLFILLRALCACRRARDEERKREKGRDKAANMISCVKNDNVLVYDRANSISDIAF